MITHSSLSSNYKRLYVLRNKDAYPSRVSGFNPRVLVESVLLIFLVLCVMCFD